MNYTRLSDWDASFSNPSTSDQSWGALQNYLVSDWGYDPNTDWGSFRRFDEGANQYEFMNPSDQSWGSMSSALRADPRLNTYLDDIFPSGTTKIDMGSYGPSIIPRPNPIPSSTPGTTTTGVVDQGFSFPDLGDVQGPYSESTSYSGIGPENQATINAWVQQLSGLLNQDAYGNVIQGAYGPAREQVQGDYAEAMKYLPYMYENQLRPALQSGINRLAGSNVLNSTVAGDLLSKLSGEVSDSILAQQAGLSGQQAQVLAGLSGQQAQAMAAYPALLSAVIGDLGRYSESTSYQEDPTATYRILASLVPYMLEYGVA